MGSAWRTSTAKPGGSPRSPAAMSSPTSPGRRPSPRDGESSPRSPRELASGRERRRGRDDDEDDEEEEKVPLIHGHRCTGFFAGLVLLNAVFIGIDVDMRAKGGDQHEHATLLLIVDIVFHGFFFLELLLRVFA